MGAILPKEVSLVVGASRRRLRRRHSLQYKPTSPKSGTYQSVLIAPNYLLYVFIELLPNELLFFAGPVRRRWDATMSVSSNGMATKNPTPIPQIDDALMDSSLIPSGNERARTDSRL